MPAFDGSRSPSAVQSCSGKLRRPSAAGGWQPRSRRDGGQGQTDVFLRHDSGHGCCRRARMKILVRPDKEGLKVSQILVEPGDTVSSAQVLARLTQDGTLSGGSATTVTAPAAGIVNAVSAVIGATASAQSGAIVSHRAGRREMELVADTPVDSLARLAPDQSAKIEIIGARRIDRQGAACVHHGQSDHTARQCSSFHRRRPKAARWRFWPRHR